MKLTQAILALGVVVFLCLSCKEDDPVPADVRDISGVWRIRTNDWHKHSAIERFGQDVFPGEFTFDDYQIPSSIGTVSYSIDGEQVDETFTYQINQDTLRIILNNLPDNQTSKYQANNLDEETILLSGITETIDEATGLMEVLTEEMELMK